jgi:hypothetical protein
MRIIYFLEDRAQERFIKALVNRVAVDEGVIVGSLTHDVRSARGGSKVIAAFKNFMKEADPEATNVLFLVVAIDGNCKGHKDRVRQLDKCIKTDHPFKGKVVYAVPDPHIERWYLMDQRALKMAVGFNKMPALPAYKCKKDYYKQLLNKALEDSDVDSLLGGVEYAERIVENIHDFDSLIRQNAGFEAFVEGLRNMFRNSMS